MTFLKRRHSQRGSVLPLMAVILFLFVTILALVVDLGVVLVNRRKMQSTANSTALESLRFDATVPLDSNPNNAPTGDLVRGNYSGSLHHREYSTYARSDFEAVDAGTEFIAVLARVRKTGEVNLSGGTAGPRLPYYFRRGVAFDHSTQQGVAIRATAIAQAQRVKAIGVADPSRGLFGATEFALTREYWDQLTLETTSVEVADAALNSAQHPGAIVGITLQPTTTTLRVTDSLIAQPSSAELQPAGYLPLVVPQANSQYRIIGFGYVDSIKREGNTLFFRKRSGHVAGNNASAQFLGLASEVASDPVLLRTLLEHHDHYWEDAAIAPFSEPLLAPTLVRAID